jgi:hypothetical protein
MSSDYYGSIAGEIADDEICPETSDGMHCGCYHDPSDRSCCACGQVNWGTGGLTGDA